MAFWVVYGKWWYKRTDIPNQIYLFKKYLYNEWYNSLDDDTRKIYDERIAKKKEMKRKETEEFIKAYDIIRSMLTSKSSGFFL